MRANLRETCLPEVARLLPLGVREQRERLGGDEPTADGVGGANEVGGGEGTPPHKERRAARVEKEERVVRVQVLGAGGHLCGEGGGARATDARVRLGSGIRGNTFGKALESFFWKKRPDLSTHPPPSPAIPRTPPLPHPRSLPLHTCRAQMPNAACATAPSGGFT